MNPERFNLLVFDWDGTMIDSIERIVTSLQYASRKVCGVHVGENQARSVIGLGLNEAIEHLLPELDIVENVALPSMAGRISGHAKARARELLSEVGLGERIGHRPQELSGGEQQRVAIARALMNDPDIIFADEPTGNLDSKTGEKVLNYLFQLVEARRHTLVLVTHSQEVASRCSRELFLKDGLLV